MVIKYPLQSDKFMIRTELNGLFLIWLTEHLVKEYFQLYVLQADTKHFVCIVLDLFEIVAYIMFEFYLLIKRLQIDKEEFFLVLNDYESFMRNHICFTYFKTFINKQNSKDLKYISFWVDYYILKELTFYGNIGEEDLADYSKKIFSDYFGDRFNTSINLLDIGTNDLTIDFPVDIKEKIQEAAVNSFLPIDEEAFDEAFQLVNNKLYNIYLSMCRNINEYRNLELLISYIDFFEIKKNRRRSFESEK